MSKPDMPLPPVQPSLPWRVTSSFVMGVTAGICRSFLYGLNRTETVGLERFLELLDGRKDIESRERGLLTVSNHVSVIDDPLLFGVLPFKYGFDPTNHKWGLGSYDLMFKNKATSAFFTMGQILPTHRTAYSTHGGLFQPTITQAIRLLSSQPFSSEDPLGITDSPASKLSLKPRSPDLDDPFTSGNFTYSTNGVDTFPAPSIYPSRRHSWVHIFPEGRIHQHPTVSMRYFRWGVSRLILESEPLPDIVPIFIDGTQEVMHESRTFPRFIPRAGKKVLVAFGEKVDGEQVFGDLRAQWKNLVDMQKEALRRKGESDDIPMGELTEGLKYATEAVALRMEVTRRVRMEVVKLRKSLGYPDEDPKESLVETWIEEGGKREGKIKDESWFKDA